MNSDIKICGMPKKKQPPPESTGFGQRLASLRKQRGVTQVQLAEGIGSTQRAITYYENEAAYPPVSAVISIAKALDVTADELLGLHPIREESERLPPEKRRLWKKLQLVAELPDKDQRAVIRLVNSLAQVNGAARAS